MEIGMKGSTAHVLTNDKIVNKEVVLSEIWEENAKDTLVIGGATAAAGTAAVAIAEKGSYVGQLKTKAGELLSKIPVEIKGENLKEVVKNSKVYTKLNSLPPQAKALIVAAALAIPVFGLLGSAAKSGYIEGQHENEPRLFRDKVIR